MIYSVFLLVEFTALFYSHDGNEVNEPKTFKKIKCQRKCNNQDICNPIAVIFFSFFEELSQQFFVSG